MPDAQICEMGLRLNQFLNAFEIMFVLLTPKSIVRKYLTDCMLVSTGIVIVVSAP
jgi:hypothetical protein